MALKSEWPVLCWRAVKQLLTHFPKNKSVCCVCAYAVLCQ